MPIMPTGGATLRVSGLTASATAADQFDKLELSFNVEGSVATTPQFPYDASTVAGLTTRNGITVDGLFLPPGQGDWSQAVVQPGFLYQDYQYVDRGFDWLHPQGTPVWKVRFAPTAQGTWQYKVRVQDDAVCLGAHPCNTWVESSTGSFSVGPPAAGNHGFVKVSAADRRYFEFSDGTPFQGLGYNEYFTPGRLLSEITSRINDWSANGVSLIRWWLPQYGVVGSAWSPWTWVDPPYYGGYIPESGLRNRFRDPVTLLPTPDDLSHEYTFSLNTADNNGVPCLFFGLTQGQITVKPNTTYRLSVEVKIVQAMSGPRVSNRPDYGLTAKIAGWPGQAGAVGCPDTIASAPAILPYKTSAGGWETVSADITTAGNHFVLGGNAGYLTLMLDNVNAGHARVRRIVLQEVIDPVDNVLGPDILVKSRGDMHLDFSQLASWKVDYAIEQARAKKNVFFKLVINEKNDKVWNSIQSNSTDSSGDLTYDSFEISSNRNFYAIPNSKVRRLHEYYWRYLAARWGYATSIHSFEAINEGDPFSSRHYEHANAFAHTMHQLDPNRHLVSTSNWHSFPNSQFWGNSSYPEIDYADLHAYVNPGVNVYEWELPTGAALETDPTRTYQGTAGAVRVAAGASANANLRAVSVRGQGTWTISVRIKADNLTGNTCLVGQPALPGPQLLVTVTNLVVRAVPDTANDPVDPFNASTQFAPAFPQCTSPGGTYDYTLQSATVDFPDDDWRTMYVSFLNKWATSGTAWFDDLVVRSPSGQTLRLYGDGSFDDRLPRDDDFAWLVIPESLKYGANSPEGARKPVLRGEFGSRLSDGSEEPALARDAKGVWLHNLLWATLNPGGMYALYWYRDNIHNHNLYFQFKPLSDFLGDIPLNNGTYRDASPSASSVDVRALGQIDPVNGRAHLWIQNQRHTWRNVVDGVAYGSLSGTVMVGGVVPGGTYLVEWWPFNTAGTLTQPLPSQALVADGSGNLTLDLSTLPSSVTDAGVKIRFQGGASTPTVTPTPTATPTLTGTPATATPTATPTSTAMYSTVVKTWDFAGVPESWTALTGGSSSASIETNDGSPAAGSLKVIMTAGSAATDPNVVLVQGTWERFGVPVGSTVRAVRLARIRQRTATFSGAGASNSWLVLLRGATGGAPSLLLASQPESGVEASWSGDLSGPIVGVPAALSASGTTVQFGILANTSTGLGGGTVDFRWDHISLQIAFTSAAQPTATRAATGTATYTPTDTPTPTPTPTPTVTATTSPLR